MVLASRARPLTLVHRTAQRNILHLHTRVGVTSRLSFRMLGPAPGAANVPAPALVATRRRPGVQGDHPAAIARQAPYARAVPRRAAPAFVSARSPLSVHAARAFASEGPSSAPLPALVARWRTAFDSAPNTRALVIRLRQRAARQEIAVPDRTRVLRSSPRPDGPTAASRRAEQALEIPRGRAEASPFAAAPPVDVDALTSQVIQQLDRRLIAYRERMGRA
jgi:hypothetical protein